MSNKQTCETGSGIWCPRVQGMIKNSKQVTKQVLVSGVFDI